MQPTTTSPERALRILLVANDGFSAGHVVRTVAIARALSRRARARSIETRLLLCTTSEAEAFFAREPLAVVRLPAPAAARRAGFSDAERRRLVRATLEGACTSYGPDLVVVDTFPSGPHDELAGLALGRAKRALVRRSVTSGRELEAGLDGYHLAVVADDPVACPLGLSLPVVRVPAITAGETDELLNSGAARAALGLPRGARVLLVASGGGGDDQARARAEAVAASLLRLVPDVVVAVARGPLAPEGPPSEDPRLRTLRVAPLWRHLRAFDGAIAAAGYNTAHELAKAGVPAVLFAQARPFDDQAARAARFAEAGLARVLERFDDDGIAAAASWLSHAPRPEIAPGGADRAADALLDLVARA